MMDETLFEGMRAVLRVRSIPRRCLLEAPICGTETI